MSTLESGEVLAARLPSTHTLSASGLVAGYGAVTALDGAAIEVKPGEIVGLLGRNGMGKTTLVNTLMGLLRSRAGSVHLGEKDISELPAHARSRAGIAIVPQGRRVFGSLSVDETLNLAHRPGRGWTATDAFGHFPRLGERRSTRARNLSGGEQSLLAVARAMATGPDIVLLDEPSEGLSPGALGSLRDVLEQLRASGLGMLLVEQNLQFALDLADRVVVMSRGRIVAVATADEVRADAGLITHHLSI